MHKEKLDANLLRLVAESTKEDERLDEDQGGEGEGGDDEYNDDDDDEELEAPASTHLGGCIGESARLDSLMETMQNMAL